MSDNAAVRRSVPGTSYRNWPLEAIGFGGDYNPEQWPREVWREDIALMRQAGVNLVSLGIFSWGLVEPSEGEFDFGWLDEVVQLLTEAGIRFNMATPTAAPPQWFFQRYPQARVANRDGVPLGPWSRGAASPSSLEYRAAIARVARAIGEHFGAHPNLVMWHVHNEYGAPVSESFDAASATHFRDWVRLRYGTLASLNDAWGTAFWGQTVSDWCQVVPPGPTASAVNPALRLDWARFTSEALAECFVIERDILHEVAPDVPVTTNFMAHTCPSMDLWRWSQLVDVVSNDHYLIAERPENHIELALDADLTRSLAGGRPWVLMEHSTSHVNWQPRNISKRPGEMARNSLSHLARGADAILFFQWRASRKGAEKYHSAMLPHGGTRTRVWREVCDLGRTLQQLRPVLGSTVTNDVAILWDWQSNWAHGLDWRPSIDLTPRDAVDDWYTALWKLGYGVDFASPEHDLSGYRVVLAPSLYLLTDAGRDNLSGFVRAGGTLVVGPFTGIVNANDDVREGGLNAALEPVVGSLLAEFAPLHLGERVTVVSTGETLASSDQLECSVFTEQHLPSGAETLAVFSDGPLPGEPAVLRHAYGQGTAWQFAASFGIDSLEQLLRAIMQQAGVERSTSDGSGVETIVREGSDHARHVFHIDHRAGHEGWRHEGPEARD